MRHVVATERTGTGNAVGVTAVSTSRCHSVGGVIVDTVAVTPLVTTGWTLLVLVTV